MDHCEHDSQGICKSCRQTIEEGGTVRLTAIEAKPEKEAAPPDEPPRSRRR